MGNKELHVKDSTNASTKKEVVRRRLRRFVSVTTGVLLFLLIVVLVIVFFKTKPVLDMAKSLAYERLDSIDVNTFKKLEDTTIYDNKGNKLGEINISNYSYVPLDSISDYIKDGYIAVEDVNFMVHGGIDYKAMTRAVFALVRNKGKITQGGSTITQQVLKNNVLIDIKDKYQRKIVEFFLAPQFEKKYTKGNIMEFYCNTNFYSNNCYGVETASRYYFGKAAKDVTLAEAAVLVGLSNNPSAYNPVRNKANALEKRHFVLSRMLEVGKISQEQFNEADKEELTLSLLKDSRTKESYQVSYAIHCTVLELLKKQGFVMRYTFNSKDDYEKYKKEYSESYYSLSDKVRGGGYTIYTSLDNEKQSKLQSILDTRLNMYTEKTKDGRYAMQGAATVVNNVTGYVEAIVGGRGTDDEFNRGYQGFRQPGSTIKPLVDYAPAFETGRFYPSLVVKDEKIKNGPYNAGKSFRGNVSIREALGRSLNTVAFKLLLDITSEVGISYLDKLKFSDLSYLDSSNNSLSIGGFTYGTTTVEMAKAYSTLVTKGVYSDGQCVTKILFQDGSIMYDGKVKYTKVYTEDSAYMVLDCLKGVITAPYGTGKNMAVPGVIVAGKTGTTNGNKDGWFCGVSNYYSMAVWCGYDTPREIPEMGGGKFPGAIFKDMFVHLHKGLGEKDFVKPSTVFSKSVDRRGKMVNYKTINQGLFSQIAIDRLKEDERVKAEKRRLAEEERKKGLEKKKEKDLKERLVAFSNLDVSDYTDVSTLDSEYGNLVDIADSMLDSVVSDKYHSKIDSLYSKINSSDNTIKVRARIAEEARLEELEFERQETIRKERVKETKISNLKESLNSLKTWGSYKGDKKKILSLRDSALTSLEDISSYDEYVIYEQVYSELSWAITDYLDTISEDVKPVVTIPEKVSDEAVKDMTNDSTSSTSDTVMDTSVVPDSMNSEDDFNDYSNQPISE